MPELEDFPIFRSDYSTTRPVNQLKNKSASNEEHEIKKRKIAYSRAVGDTHNQQTHQSPRQSDLSDPMSPIDIFTIFPQLKTNSPQRTNREHLQTCSTVDRQSENNYNI